MLSKGTFSSHAMERRGLSWRRFENDSQSTLDDYRQQLLAENYTGAKIDYAPVKDKWFVLSGTRGDTHFYERVSFTCGGKLINSWALLLSGQRAEHLRSRGRSHRADIYAGCGPHRRMRLMFISCANGS